MKKEVWDSPVTSESAADQQTQSAGAYNDSSHATEDKSTPYDRQDMPETPFNHPILLPSPSSNGNLQRQCSNENIYRTTLPDPSILKARDIPAKDTINSPVHRDEDLIPPAQRHGQIRAPPEEVSGPTPEAPGLALAIRSPTLKQSLRVPDVRHDAQVVEAEGMAGEVVVVESLGQPDGLLVGDLGGYGEGAGGKSRHVAQAPDVLHDGFAVFVLGLKLDAEAVVDEDAARFGVAFDDPVFLVGEVRRAGGDFGGVDGEIVDCVEGFADEWVHHVAGAPDAHADADVAFFFGAEGVDAAFHFVFGMVGAFVGEAESELLHVVGGFDLDALAFVVSDGVVGEGGVKHWEDFGSDVVKGDSDVVGQTGVELAHVLMDQIANLRSKFHTCRAPSDDSKV